MNVSRRSRGRLRLYLGTAAASPRRTEGPARDIEQAPRVDEDLRGRASSEPALRRLVEPDPGHPERIETVAGVGYRFIPGGE
jgi:hypothetical protein